jgi:hypothetical protein
MVGGSGHPRTGAYGVRPGPAQSRVTQRSTHAARCRPCMAPRNGARPPHCRGCGRRHTDVALEATAVSPSRNEARGLACGRLVSVASAAAAIVSRAGSPPTFWGARWLSSCRRSEPRLRWPRQRYGRGGSPARIARQTPCGVPVGRPSRTRTDEQATRPAPVCASSADANTLSSSPERGRTARRIPSAESGEPAIRQCSQVTCNLRASRSS